MAPPDLSLQHATPDEIRLAASAPPCCRPCGQADGLVVPLENDGPQLTLYTAWAETTILFDGWHCPRCQRRILTEIPLDTDEDAP